MTKEDLARLLATENKAALASALDILDDRELELFSLLGQGYSGGRIVSMLTIDPQQLDALKQSIRSKLKLKNELELLRSAARHSRTS